MPGSSEEIKQVTERLEQLCPRAGAKIRIRVYGGGADESRLEANRAGYLRLAVESLKAADAPFIKTSEKAQFAIEADWGDLFTEDSDVQIDWFERRDDFTSPPMKSTLTDRVMSVVFGLLLGLWLAFSVVGLVATIIWLF